MKILSLSVKHHAEEWDLEETTFESFTLLVGASGVGKTTILKAILNLSSIAVGRAINGFEWKVTFISKGSRFTWEGQFDNQAEIPYVNSEMYIPPPIQNEKITHEGEIILKRESQQVFWKGRLIPQLAINQSAVPLLQEPEMLMIYVGFVQLIRHSTFAEQFNKAGVFSPQLKYQTLQAIQAAREPINGKLYYAQHLENDDTFEKILHVFKDVFPTVEDVQIAVYDELKGIQAFSQLPIIQIKEKGVARWISQFGMSSGMLRVLIHLAEIYLCPSASVILIDEFENSLGVNCMDAIIAEMQNAQRELQFIITSHHPYIINSVDFQHWKLVTRKGGVISALTQPDAGQTAGCRAGTEWQTDCSDPEAH